MVNERFMRTGPASGGRGHGRILEHVRRFSARSCPFIPRLALYRPGNAVSLQVFRQFESSGVFCSAARFSAPPDGMAEETHHKTARRRFKRLSRCYGRAMQTVEDETIAGLIARVALRDRAAFNALYQASAPKLFGVCRRILPASADAEDALQETYVKIWNKAGSFAPDGRSAFGWLISIARHQAIDMARRKRDLHAELDEAQDLADDAPDAEALLMTKADGEALDRCLAELDSRRAAALRFAYVEGWSYQDIAENYAIPLNTVRTWLRRGLLALRECMQR
jgi:RNA polymerase sigma-70 factor (ECF subfamily)